MQFLAWTAMTVVLMQGNSWASIGRMVVRISWIVWGCRFSACSTAASFPFWPGQTHVPPVPRLTEASDERPQRGEGSIPARHLRGWGKCMQAEVGLDVHKAYLMGGAGLHRWFSGGAARGQGGGGKLQEAARESQTHQCPCAPTKAPY